MSQELNDLQAAVDGLKAEVTASVDTLFQRLEDSKVNTDAMKVMTEDVKKVTTDLHDRVTPPVPVEPLPEVVLDENGNPVEPQVNHEVKFDENGNVIEQRVDENGNFIV